MKNKEQGIQMPGLPAPGSTLMASQLICVLVDQMAAKGDFEVTPGSLGEFQDCLGFEFGEMTTTEDINPVAKAAMQGGNAAGFAEVEKEHCPYPAGSLEAEAWTAAFLEKRGEA